MSFPRWMSTMRRIAFVGVVVLLTAAVASAQSSNSQSQSDNSQSQSSAAGFSSSSESNPFLLAESAVPASPSALPSAPSSAAAGGGQEYNGGWGRHLMNHYALEFGGGYSTPESNSVTYGGNFTVGAGVNFNRRLAALIEYQFIDDKLPGYLIAEAGANGGNVHIWSFTIDPVFDLFPKSRNDFYVTGGGGFYRKMTNFTDPTWAYYCDYFYGCYPGEATAVVGHFSSNQGGVNIGGGYQYRVGGRYDANRMKLFAEVRYLDVLSPAVTTKPNGLGTTTVGAGTRMLPVTLGLRW
jgi:hypothetical protein